MTTPPRSMDLVDYVRELTEPHQHREHFTIRRGHTWYGQDHTTRVPSLLVQLEYATPTGQGEERANTGYASRPAGRLEALATLTTIDLEVSAWVRDLGEDDPTSTAACLRLLSSLMPSADPVTRRHVLRDVRRWWTQARVVTGWDSPAWRPDNTCPMCGERGSLRVRWADKAALCTECRETWDEANIGLLADHIRAESQRMSEPRAPREPCRCPWPKPVVADLSALCPWCGSARCVHALVQRQSVAS
jgi:uncharacterized protein (DUF983 family)